MLKFNIKEHNLEELKRYGFMFHKRLKYYCTCGSMRTSGDLITVSQIMILPQSDFEVDISTYIESEDKHLTTVDFTLKDLLYDLIKDGLIIKE